MLTLHLHKLKFFAFHGIYKEEQILGNEFEVSADVEVTIAGGKEITKIRDTVNYMAVYEVIKQRMILSTPLLETVAQELTRAIGKIDNRIKSVSITIKKLSPPIENFQGTVGVSYKQDF